MTNGLLAGRIAVITGGAGGIGGGVTRRFSAEGATVVVNDIDAELLDAMVAHVTSEGGHIFPVLGDIREATTVASLAEIASQVDNGRVDIVVNNVGDYRPTGRFLEAGEDNWEALYAINLEHVFRVTKAFAPGMIERGRGNFINVSTVEAIRGYPGGPVYAAFNAGVIAFTRSLAVDLGRHGVRVNAIAPDLADSLQTPAAMQLRGRDPAMTRHWSPIGRFGHADEYGNVAVFLASDLSSFVTGSIVPVDGGTVAAGGWYLRSDGRGFTNSPDAP